MSKHTDEEYAALEAQVANSAVCNCNEIAALQARNRTLVTLLKRAVLNFPGWTADARAALAATEPKP